MLGQLDAAGEEPDVGLVGVKAQMHFVAPGTSILEKGKMMLSHSTVENVCARTCRFQHYLVGSKGAF